MKNQILNLLIVATILSVYSCRKADQRTSLTEEDAVEMISNALGKTDNGITYESDQAIALNMNAKNNALCGRIDTVKRNRSNTYRNRQHDYEVSSIREIICKDGVPIEIKINSTFNGTFSGPRLESVGEGVHQGTLSELNSTSSEYHYVGEAKRYGNGTLKRRKVAVESTLDLNSDIYIAKDTELISRGVTNFTLIGNTDSGVDFEYLGKITFHGNKKATVEINGKSHEIDY
ncbi:MAG: hypothetical protein MRY83_00175 [Flavobacteriales bacterium]|nr:hypothetical protein [Flavobacteriales bacterium]